MQLRYEPLSRMHLHQKTDYWFDNQADQAHLFGLSQYLPNNVVVAPSQSHGRLLVSLDHGFIAVPGLDCGRTGL
jgi:hypothetical protein